MGDLNVRLVSDQKDLQSFTAKVLKDIQAFEIMLDNGWFPSEGPIHLGAEQEICLVDSNCKPAPYALEILEGLGENSKFTTELAKFNIEANLDPRELTGTCLTDLESEIHEVLGDLTNVAKKYDVDYALTGILPTIRKFDLELDNLTPLKRYKALMSAITKLRGKSYDLRLNGIDELNIKFNSPMLESCNTSFQVHLQVHPQDFVRKYNAAQLFAAPVLAVSANSPLLFGKRLWHETRLALFQQSVDTRVTSEHIRDKSPRVMFGNDWLKDSILELYKEDIMRFRVMLMADVDEDVETMIENKEVPKLRALMIHNSTVYRWNRPCYGISPDGRPHLRIENRVFPSGPTPTDEVANTAFWLGLMNGFEEYYEKIPEYIDFADVKKNFLSAAISGIDCKVTWFEENQVSVSSLILDELIPIAKKGLELKKVDTDDIDKYLGIIKSRAENRQTGTNWIINSFRHFDKESNRDELSVALTYSMIAQQKENKPVHLWELAKADDIVKWHPESLLVEEFMATDLFTVHKDDILKLVADMMDWQKLRYVPVEDKNGTLTGLVTSRMLLRYIANDPDNINNTVADLMIAEPICIEPESTIYEAMNILRENRIGCLPVVKNSKLIGIVTEHNFLTITATLMKMIAEKKGGGADQN